MELFLKLLVFIVAAPILSALVSGLVMLKHAPTTGEQNESAEREAAKKQQDMTAAVQREAARKEERDAEGDATAA